MNEQKPDPTINKKTFLQTTTTTKKSKNQTAQRNNNLTTTNLTETKAKTKLQPQFKKIQ